MNQSTTTRGVPFHRNPALAPAVNALSTTLWGAGYHEHAREKIVRLAWITGDPTASVELCDEDHQEAVDAWIEALPEVPFDHPSWDNATVVLDVELLANGTHPFPFGPEEPERDPLGPGPFILLGPDDGGPMDPEDLDRRRAAIDRHSPEGLALFSLALYGRSEPFHA